MTKLLALVACVGLSAVSAQESAAVFELTRGAVLSAEGYLDLDLPSGTRVQLLKHGVTTSTVSVRGDYGSLAGQVETAALRELGTRAPSWGDPMAHNLPARVRPTSWDPVVTVGDLFAQEEVFLLNVVRQAPVTTQAGAVVLNLRPRDAVVVLGLRETPGSSDAEWYVYVRGATGFVPASCLSSGDYTSVESSAVLKREARTRPQASTGILGRLDGEDALGTLNDKDATAYTIEGSDAVHGSSAGRLTLGSAHQHARFEVQTLKGSLVFEGAISMREGLLRGRLSGDEASVFWVKIQTKGDLVRGTWQFANDAGVTAKGRFTGERSR